MLENISAFNRSMKNGRHTLVMEWQHWQTATVDEMARRSSGDVGHIELMRLGTLGQRTATVALSLPPEIFTAAMERYRKQDRCNSLADCVFDAIYAAYAVELQETTLQQA